MYIVRKNFKVPKSTIIDHVRSNKPIDTLTNIKLGRNPASTFDLEQSCPRDGENFFGLRASDIRRLAFQLAIRNGLKRPCSTRSAASRKKWLKSFMSRNPQLSFRKPQRISAARDKDFTKENVQAVFILLKSALLTINNNPAAIWNQFSST